MDIPHTPHFWAPQPGSCYDTNFGGGVCWQKGTALGFHPPPLAECLCVVTRAAGSLKRDGLKIKFVREGAVISWALGYGH